MASLASPLATHSGAPLSDDPNIRGDVPIAKLVYWSIRSTFCPEPYIDIAVEPGKKTRWTYTYDFYDIP